MTDRNDIYDPEYVANLFDRCSPAYRWWSAVASFGMVRLWRQVCVKALPSTTNPHGVFVDLMAGTGEVWPHLLRRFPSVAEIRAIDISKRMHEQALKRLRGKRAERITHVRANALDIDLDASSVDCVLSSFGLKTFNTEQQSRIASHVSRVLKPGGTYTFIEASDPTSWLLQPMYRFYLDSCLPLVERFALNGAQDFSMIGAYTRQFGNCDHFAQALKSEGLDVTSYSHFFGCATGVYGSKPGA